MRYKIALIAALATPLLSGCDPKQTEVSGGASVAPRQEKAYESPAGQSAKFLPAAYAPATDFSGAAPEDAASAASRLFDGARMRDGVTAAGYTPDAGATGRGKLLPYTAASSERITDLRGAVPPVPDTNATNPIGAKIERFMHLARAAKNYCYAAVANVLEAAGLIKIPPQFSDRAYQFATAFDHNVSGVKSRFEEANPASAYPFRRGTVLVWGGQNCSVSGSAAGRASGHIEIVKRLNCSDPTQPSRGTCPSITNRHFATVDRTYSDISYFSGKRHERTGQACLRAFVPRTPLAPAEMTSI